MKSTVIVYAIAAAALGLGSLSLAQGHDGRGARGEAPRVQQHDQNRYDRHAGRREVNRFDRWEDRRFAYADARRHDGQIYYNARGPEFRRGGYLPREFRNHQYVVTDYRSYRLGRPPYGHQWVQVGADYVLIAMATGLIAHIVLNH